MLMWGRFYLGKLTLMVRNPCMWHAPMNKTEGTPLGEMADQTVVGSVHNLDHGAFASAALCGGSLKASDSLPLVSPTAIINMSRGQFNVDVAATFGVSLINVGDLDVLIKDIEAGNHEELLSGMTNNMREAVMDALVAMCDSIQADNTNAGAIPCKSVSIQDKPGSYIAAAGGSRPKPSAVGGSKLDPNISKANFRSLFSKKNCEGFNVSISRKVVETVFSKDGLSIIASQIGKPIMLDYYTSLMCIESWGRSSFARYLIEINAEDVLKESLTIGVPLIEDTRCRFLLLLLLLLFLPTPIVEMTNGGFQTVGKMKKKGKSKSINGGQIGGHLVKQNVRYEPKVTTINQYVLPLSNVGLR
ncbi:hypothetical protein Tco_1401588 [Tanacetum coccineum]